MLVEDFLMSGHILIPVLFIVIAAWLARLAYQNLETALEARLEKGMPAMLSMQDMQAASLALRDKQTDKSPKNCLLYTSPSPRDLSTSRMPSSA